MDSLTILALKKAESGGGGDITVESLSVSANGTYTATTGKAYSPVSVSVPQTTVSSLSVTENGTYTATAGTAYSPVSVEVPQTTVTSLSVTGNGTYTATEGTAYSPVTVNVPGLEYETGTYIPANDIAKPTITFQNQHSKSPFFAIVVDATGTADQTSDTHYMFHSVDVYRYLGHGIPRASETDNYFFYEADYRASSTTMITKSATFLTSTSDETGTDYSYPSYYVTNTELKPSAGSATNKYWRPGRTYKWLAIWAPST